MTRGRLRVLWKARTSRASPPVPGTRTITYAWTDSPRPEGLVRNGWARRVPDPDDRRRVDVEAVSLTARELQDPLGPVRHRIGAVLALFGPDELRVLQRYFEPAAPALREAAADTGAAGLAARSGATPSP
ncbi:hypothetical protein OG897_11030 [Streptomyces sp. NBC_00237]|uniref:hypothetical protein n=1 Tax=Streptomyces sp. NBC_00237 TaxID=2975687 RepID=UPI0022597EB4|nr:hypothetical protein [Streptomyces sp. NBC_00237]MCX5201982.1 hypothetical protein [Streptomyces sp. NBC_00237]